MASDLDGRFDYHATTTPTELLGSLDSILDDESTTGFGTFSAAVYDTAWLSMLHNKEDRTSWLFPECFDYLLNSQQEDGTWESYAFLVDGILNTLAALLALLTHRRAKSATCTEDSTLLPRIQKAQGGLQKLLQTWDIEQSDNVGFEILVPSLLHQLRDFGIHFRFPGHQRLLHLRDEKLKKFKPELVYSQTQTTILHSLEALVGLVDFDKVRHHCTEETGILGSPAATAAYLLHCSEWDERAVTYLRTALNASETPGAVPSAFPTSIFEICWALSTILLSPDPKLATETAGLIHASEFLKALLEKQNGATGFAPGVLVDADDTSRLLLTLQLLGKDVDLISLMKRFESESYFRTYELEQKPSFSANCNILLTFLESKSCDLYIKQVEKLLVFLFSRWRSGNVHDKWNISSAYSSMLLSRALVRMLERRDVGQLSLLPADLIHKQTPMVFSDLLSQTLTRQLDDGSWAESVEVTAYSILTLVQCLKLPWHPNVKELVERSVSQGREYMASRMREPSRSDYVWVEKVTYGSSILKKAYCVTALHASCQTIQWTADVLGHYGLSSSASKLEIIFERLPLFRRNPLKSLPLAMIEAKQYARCLREHRFKIFPRDQTPMTEDKYLEFIPVLWTACNQLGQQILPSAVLWEMMLLSMLNFQVDEYMESIVIHLTKSSLRILRSVIAERCELKGRSDMNTKFSPCAVNSVDQLEKDMKLDNPACNHENGPLQDSVSLNSIAKVIGTYINHVLQHPAVVRSPEPIQKALAAELHNFLLAHINHNLDNLHLRSSPKPHLEAADGHLSKHINEASCLDLDYFRWVHSVGADDTSCPFSFQFFACLISPSGQSCFEGAQAKYLSKTLARHLAVMCRQYNDYGSAARDADEKNLNSLDFADFQKPTRDVSVDSEKDLINGYGSNDFNFQAKYEGICQGESQADNTMLGECPAPANSHSPVAAMQDNGKKNLLEIAEFERTFVQLALQNMRNLNISSDTIKAVEIFINLTDLFGQVYVQKDIASRIEK